MRLGRILILGALMPAALVAPASADGGLSLAISTQRIEGAPITFTATGVAPGPVDSFGDSADFVQGAVIPQTKACPVTGADSFGDIAGAVVTTVHAFPTGPFTTSATVQPTGVDAQTLLAGAWRECVYLQDRGTNAVTAFAQQDFTVRQAHVSARVLKVPRHIRLRIDVLGRPIGSATFVVRARAEVPLRVVEVVVEPPGQHRTCFSAALNPHYGGLSNPYRVKVGLARTYRVRTDLIFPAGRPPYGKRLLACAVVAYRDPNDQPLTPEGFAQTSFVLRP